MLAADTGSDDDTLATVVELEGSNEKGTEAAAAAETKVPPTTTAATATATATGTPGGVVTILGVPLPLFPGRPQARVWVLMVLVVVVYLVIYVLQESIFKRQKCSAGGFVTCLHFVLFWAFALLERANHRRARRRELAARHLPTADAERVDARRAPLRYHVLLGFYACAGFALSTYSMQLLNFPTWLLFKSARVITTMLGSVVLLGKRYTWLEYLGVVCIFVGLVVFSWGDFVVLPEFHLPGVVLVLLALVANSLQDNTQEQGMRRYGASENELLVYSFGFGALWLLPLIVVRGELRAGVLFCWQHPLVFVQILVVGVLSYVGTALILSLLRETSALVTTITTSCRKALSIIASFLLFSKPFSMNYVYGTLLVFSGILINFFARTRRRPSHK